MTKIDKKKLNKARQARLAKRLEPILGMKPTGDEPPDGPQGDDVNLLTAQQVPSSSWRNVKKDQIGAGFEEVDISVFDNPSREGQRVAPDISLFSRPFHNPFIHGRSRFIEFEIRVRAKKKVVKQRQKPINSHNKIGKTEKKKFGQRLSKNIDNWKKLFVDDILPATLSVHSAAEDIKEIMSQMVDDKVHLPLDFIQTQVFRAAQLRMIRAIGQTMGLTPEEQMILAPEFVPRNKPK